MTTIYERLRPLRLLGSLLEVVRIFFRKDGYKIEWKPNQGHTYEADMTYEFPAPDTATTESDILVGEKALQTLENKTLNFNPLVGGNSAEDIPLSSMKQDNTAPGKVIVRDAMGFLTNSYIGEAQLDSSLSSTISGLDTRVSSLEAGGGSGSSLEVVNEDWTTGTTKTISHSLGTDVQVQVFDKSNGQMLFVDTVEVSSTEVVLTASQAPGASGWRVTIQKNS